MSFGGEKLEKTFANQFGFHSVRARLRPVFGDYALQKSIKEFPVQRSPQIKIAHLHGYGEAFSQNPIQRDDVANGGDSVWLEGLRVVGRQAIGLFSYCFWRER